MEAINEEKKKREPNPNLPKPCGFRVNVGEQFWYMMTDGKKVMPKMRIETEESRWVTNKKGEKVDNKSSINGILADNGNYFRTAQECIYRIVKITSKSK